eukprot:603394-Rhodomonas_salina.1
MPAVPEWVEHTTCQYRSCGGVRSVSTGVVGAYKKPVLELAYRRRRQMGHQYWSWRIGGASAGLHARREHNLRAIACIVSAIACTVCAIACVVRAMARRGCGRVCAKREREEAGRRAWMTASVSA